MRSVDSGLSLESPALRAGETAETVTKTKAIRRSMVRSFLRTCPLSLHPRGPLRLTYFLGRRSRPLEQQIGARVYNLYGITIKQLINETILLCKQFTRKPGYTGIRTTAAQCFHCAPKAPGFSRWSASKPCHVQWNAPSDSAYVTYSIRS